METQTQETYVVTITLPHRLKLSESPATVHDVVTDTLARLEAELCEQFDNGITVGYSAHP